MNHPTTTHEDRRSERGVGMVEYALLVGLIAMASLTAIGQLGDAVNDAIVGPDPDVVEEEVVEYTQDKTVGTDEIQVTFGVLDGVIVLDDIDADGWDYTITKQTGTRINLKFKNPESGKVVKVSGWLNKKGVLKTKVK